MVVDLCEHLQTARANELPKMTAKMDSGFGIKGAGRLNAKCRIQSAEKCYGEESPQPGPLPQRAKELNMRKAVLVIRKAVGAHCVELTKPDMVDRVFSRAAGFSENWRNRGI